MLFLSNVFLSLGDSGLLPPVYAAWVPNAIFGALAIFLFQRRLAGRPIYQTLRKFVPSGA
jgi:lipopolysaccharide export LptBFGC system permease protein LptF